MIGAVIPLRSQLQVCEPAVFLAVRAYHAIKRTAGVVAKVDELIGQPPYATVPNYFGVARLSCH